MGNGTSPGFSTSKNNAWPAAISAIAESHITPLPIFGSPPSGPWNTRLPPAAPAPRSMPNT
jgi:hypothetical protein